MSISEAWDRAFGLRVVLILITGAMSITTGLLVAAVIGIWGLSGDVRENTTLIRTFDTRLQIIERSRSGGIE